MKQIIKFFESKDIEFRDENGEVYMRANSVADSKTIENWKASPNTKRYIEALINSLDSSEYVKTLENSSKKRYPIEFVIVQEGRNGGTWIHEKLILNFAKWISVDFEIWVDNVIKKILQDGYYISKDINEKQIEKLKQTLNSMELELLRTKSSLQTIYRQKEEYRIRMEKTKEYKADYYSFERELRDRNEIIQKQNTMLAQARLEIKEMEGE
jgi:prophage antirepressor-like protein